MAHGGLAVAGTHDGEDVGEPQHGHDHEHRLQSSEMSPVQVHRCLSVKLGQYQLKIFKSNCVGVTFML